MLKFSQKLSNVYNPFKINRKCSKVIRTSLDIFSNIQKFFENRRKSSEVAGMFLEIPVMMRQKSHTFHSDKVGRYTVAIDILTTFVIFHAGKREGSQAVTACVQYTMVVTAFGTISLGSCRKDLLLFPVYCKKVLQEGCMLTLFYIVQFRKYPYSPHRRFSVLHPPSPQKIPV